MSKVSETSASILVCGGVTHKFIKNFKILYTILSLARHLSINAFLTILGVFKI